MSAPGAHYGSAGLIAPSRRAAATLNRVVEGAILLALAGVFWYKVALREEGASEKPF